ncbi:CBS domain-containing protein [Vagococcus sp.]|uniref:CBS domain-containing protein n=1 Tax=Vagococcus sp. TaxID=1933889 RepID=UPI003F996697
MLVKDFMRTGVITITEDEKIVCAVELMKKHDIHRLPVIKQGKLIGLVTEGTIQEAMPSKATSLSVYEMNYLINKTVVKDVMIKQVKTIGPDSLLEDAIYEMRSANIGVLPVVNTANEVIGIITNNDIFDAFLEVTGYLEAGTRVVVKIPDDHTGVLAHLTQLFSKEKLNIVQIVVFRKTNEPIIIIQLTATDAEAVKRLLSSNGYDVLSALATLPKTV